MPHEQWQDIPGWEGLYQISTRGRVRSLPRSFIRRNGTPFTVRGRVLKPCRRTGRFVVLADRCRYVYLPIDKCVRDIFGESCVQ
jgi:hypothetical protein